MNSTRIGIGRLVVLVLIFLALAAVAADKFLDFGSLSSGDSSGNNSVAAEDNAVARPRGKVVWLQANQAKYGYCYKGIIARELFRQALLIAARDGLGLQTRDASLREWRTEPADENGLGMDFESEGIKLRDVEAPASQRWHHLYSERTWPTNLNSIAEADEKLSREDFVSILKKAGWSGNGNATKADAPAPVDAETRLMDMEELSQLGVLRETHAAVRTDGESLPRLGALVRAYANLGQLTRYHWSLEYAVYTARSLLYAQRMVAANPNSAFALWHRAYARAMAGMQGGALADLEAAGQLGGDDPPDWVKLLDPFCKYQTAALVNLATGEKQLATLGTFLAFLSVEHSGSQGATMNFAQAAFTLNPQCLRIVEAMCEQTGPGMLNELAETGPTVFSQTLGTKLQKLPAFPKQVSDQIDSFRRPEGNPNGRETICQELIDEGAPEKDATEPSWAALGRLVQETTFAHVARKTNLIAFQWGVDASDYVAEVQPLIKDHPYKFVIDVDGLQHNSGDDLESVKQVLKKPMAAQKEATLRQMPVYRLAAYYKCDGAGSGDKYWGMMVENSDDTSCDIENIMALNPGHENTEWGADQLAHLRIASPQSPVLIALNIRAHWNADKAIQWESEHGDYPSVAMALGEKYSDLKRWEDAERCFRKYIAVSPDQRGYEGLASIYKKQQKDDQWLATLNEFLAKGTDYGLQDAQVQVEIANYYMDKHHYKSALPYADAAAETASGWGMECAAKAHTGLGDWKAAEQLVVDDMNHYSLSPYYWYTWCDDTGHGDIGSARRTFLTWLDNKKDRMESQDYMELACVQLEQQQTQNALATFQARMKQNPGPTSALYIALLDDELHDSKARDAALDQIQTLSEQDEHTGRFALLLRDAAGKGSTLPLDAAKIDAIVKGSTESVETSIYAILGRYLFNHGQTAEAIDYFKRCVRVNPYFADRIWVEPLLRQLGVDPWPLQTVVVNEDVSN